MIGTIDLYTLQPPGETLRCITVDRDTVVVRTTSGSRKGSHQTRRITITTGISAGLFHTQHLRTDQCHLIDGLLLVDCGTNHHLAQINCILAKGKIHQHLLCSDN